VFRRLGIRTSSEIAEERYALKSLRGDFGAVPRLHDGPADGAAASQALEAARR
jgi:hypothetical protein